MQPVLTLTTDFGSKDPYVAAMKGVILQLAPEARIVDVSHEIAAQDIMEAAFVLKNAAPFFPAGSVHVVVVDPGVGTDRPAVAVQHAGQTYVGPDNGVFTLLLDGQAPDRAVVLDRPEYWRTPEPSRTFHGRDVFAPVAAHLIGGVPLDRVGSKTSELKPLRWGLPIADHQGIRGWVIHVDHFGNCISNIPLPLLNSFVENRSVKCYAGSTILTGLSQTYGEVDANEPVMLFGSSGFLEIAVNAGNAAELLSIRKGDPVDLIFVEPKSSSTATPEEGDTSE